MKNYSSKRAKKGKLAYRTPDKFLGKATVRYRFKSNSRGYFKQKTV